jgi:hypothetical protein
MCNGCGKSNVLGQSVFENVIDIFGGGEETTIGLVKHEVTDRTLFAFGFMVFGGIILNKVVDKFF